MTAGPPPLPAARGRPSVGQVVLGLVLVAVGVAWLLQVVAGVDVRWELLAPLALVLVGGGVIAGARTGAHAGLIGVGLVLTLLLAVVSSLGGLGDVPFAGGIGDRVERPALLDGDATYRLAIGELEIDLRDTGLPESAVEVVATVAVGRLVVRLPATAARVDARAAAGSVRVLGESAEGLDVELTVDEESEPTVLLDLAVGVGEVVVER